MNEHLEENLFSVFLLLEYTFLPNSNKIWRRQVRKMEQFEEKNLFIGKRAL